MLIDAAHLKGLVIRATDGELGIVDQAYFDDDTWDLRYLTVDTGGWLRGRSVLVSPLSIIDADWPAGRLDVALTKKQVENSPDVDTHKPVSRQHEAACASYYGYPYYWVSPSFGGTFYPVAGANPESEYAAPVTSTTAMDSHLRSMDALTGRFIEAVDGEIGHLCGFVLDDQTWAARYIEVATRNWWPGKKILISPTWIKGMTWADATVRVGLTREAITSAPEYIEFMPISREYETRLCFHYGQVPY